MPFDALPPTAKFTVTAPLVMLAGRTNQNVPVSEFSPIAAGLADRVMLVGSRYSEAGAQAGTSASDGL